MRSFFLVAFLILPVFAVAENPPSWTRPVKPLHIVGNIYYVGSEELGAYVLAGKDGLILLDAPLEENAELVLRNVRELGFDPATIRVLLNSHAHFDHAGGLATVRKKTGAKLYMSAPDAELAARGGKGDFAFGDRYAYPPVVPDAIVGDGETVRLGDLAMTAVLTPGHTRGCTTWRTTTLHEGKPLDVLFLCSVTAPGYTLVGNEKYPEIVDDYRRSFDTLQPLRPDVFLANHASFFGLAAKAAKAKSGGGNPFVDREEFPRFLDRSRKALDAQIAAQR